MGRCCDRIWTETSLRSIFSHNNKLQTKQKLLKKKKTSMLCVCTTYSWSFLTVFPSFVCLVDSVIVHRIG